MRILNRTDSDMRNAVANVYGVETEIYLRFLYSKTQILRFWRDRRKKKRYYRENVNWRFQIFENCVNNAIYRKNYICNIFLNLYKLFRLCNIF